MILYKPRWSIPLFILAVVYFFLCFKHKLLMPNPYVFNEKDSVSNYLSPVVSVTSESINNSERELIFEERHQHVINECKKTNESYKYTMFNTERMVFEKNHFIGFCALGKVGSTFWRKALMVIGSKGRLTSPFEIKGSDIHLLKSDSIAENERTCYENNGTLFMFVRDPYARLLSAYENKIYQPNRMFWGTYAKDVIKVIRKSNSISSQKYGFDVTFPEIVKYILHLHDTGREIDQHFKPMHAQCHPCSNKYQYIGKLETIKDDAMFLFSKWRHQFNDFNLHFDHFEKETALDAARKQANKAFRFPDIIKNSKITFFKLLLRAWRNLQLRGYISKSIEFPIKETDTDTLTQSEFFESMKTALDISVNQTEVKLQREEAFVQAYRQIPMDDMERLRRYLLQDCLLFGYDDRPNKLFDRSLPINEDFDYFDGLN